MHYFPVKMNVNELKNIYSTEYVCVDEPNVIQKYCNYDSESESESESDFVPPAPVGIGRTQSVCSSYSSEFPLPIKLSRTDSVFRTDFPSPISFPRDITKNSALDEVLSESQLLVQKAEAEAEAETNCSLLCKEECDVPNNIFIGFGSNYVRDEYDFDNAHTIEPEPAFEPSKIYLEPKVESS